MSSSVALRAQLSSLRPEVARIRARRVSCPVVRAATDREPIRDVRDATVVTGRRQPQIRPSADLVARLVAEYEGGATTYDLANRHGLHRNTITAHLRRADVTIRMDRMTPEQIQQAADLYAEGWSLARVGRAVGTDAETVRKRLREAGVTIRDCHGRER